MCDNCIPDIPVFKKTTVHNLIVLDSSGSMLAIQRATLDGLNEVLAKCRQAQLRYQDDQVHFVTLVTFCGCTVRKVLDHIPAIDVPQLGLADFVPCCTTPLHDAVYTSVKELQTLIADDDDSLAVVTVITDGYENDSRHYTRNDVLELVTRLTGLGWVFTYMGGGHDSEPVARGLGISLNRSYARTGQGVRDMLSRDSNMRMSLFERIKRYKDGCMASGIEPTRQERNCCYTQMSKDAFDES